jgi:hypothetical protein
MASTQSSTVTHEKDGQTIVATYHVEHGMVTASCELGSNTTQVGGSPPEFLTRLLLREIVEGT